ncbi:MAG: hypothetical protein WCJ58_03180 [bacterium]
MNKFLLKIYQLKQTVFSIKELSLLFPEISYENLKSRLHYAISNDNLLSPRRGFFAKQGYNICELANKLYSPSYISLQTVLKSEGLIFQEYSSIYIVSYLSRKVLVDNVELIYKKIPGEIINNSTGIINRGTYFIASKERAFLDVIYLYGNFHFDNLNGLKWDVINVMKDMYKSKTLINLVNTFYKENNVASSL